MEEIISTAYLTEDVRFYRDSNRLDIREEDQNHIFCQFQEHEVKEAVKRMDNDKAVRRDKYLWWYGQILKIERLGISQSFFMRL